ncbi:HupE/UreJ family protein [Ensifer sp. ENS07]|jgi:urease accessory protein|uniref:HupE/UreJ family protein n=1 Tax=Ensifer TaxID=106591 RepID=UPI00088DB598|nr:MULTISPECIES: HupE/UreJ family protein [Ensifer]MBD9593823.1 HupE/UreJ family protein [Ensifer sp. ENS05]MBD9637064.1 HupE/UreJ family protein [Ensifer sp. ENS07]UTV35455.1 HupE/UreJ family protein [Ensifer adhaerens]SDM92173.1 urease accessory protein [Ensifer sp. YR511]
MNRRILIATAALIASAAPAFAHLNPAEHGSFAAGFSHPLFGLDHILVMVAVGLWAAQIGGRALVVVPAAFVAMMAAGFALAVAGVDLPFVEPAILASVVALGLLVAMAVRLDTAASAAIVGVFALFHGHAHGGELGSAGALAFSVGFILATAALHVAGIGLGIALQRLSGGGLLARLLGGLTALAGAALIFG